MASKKQAEKVRLGLERIVLNGIGATALKEVKVIQDGGEHKLQVVVQDIHDPGHIPSIFRLVPVVVKKIGRAMEANELRRAVA